MVQGILSHTVHLKKQQAGLIHLFWMQFFFCFWMYMLVDLQYFSHPPANIVGYPIRNSRVENEPSLHSLAFDSDEPEMKEAPPPTKMKITTASLRKLGIWFVGFSCLSLVFECNTNSWTSWS